MAVYNQSHRYTINAGPRIKVSAAYGRLYVSGPDHAKAKRVEGASFNPKSNAHEISLTLESLRALRAATGATKEQFARCCTPDVLAWVRAAAASEQQVARVHARLATGWRQEFPWDDNRAGTVAPEHEDEKKWEWKDGQRLYTYRAPFAHQQIMASAASALDGTAFLAEMGVAKTRAAIEAVRFKMERGDVGIGVVLCPRGVMGTWEREVAQWSSGITTLRLDMQVKERRRIIESYAKAMPRGRLLLILNLDVLYLLVDDLIKLAKERKLALIVDEAHRLANPQAKVTKAAIKLAQHSDWRLTMTGSPIRKGIQDIWSQWYIVDLGVTFGASSVQYRREFTIENQYNFDINAKDGALEEVGLRMRRRGLRFTKAECFDLPPKMYEKIEIELTSEQKRAYAQMEEYLVAELKDHPLDEKGDRWSSAANQLVMILRLSQITSGFLTDDHGAEYAFPKNPKLDALEELIRENTTHQQLVWGVYTRDLDSIARRLVDLKPRIIDGRQVGQKGQRERDKIEADFLAGSFRLLIGNPAAGGVGLNLQTASMAHYYSQKYSLIDRIQSEDRCHRSGSEMHNKVTYTDFIAKGTIDEIISAAIAEKKEISEVVVDLRHHIGLD